MSTLRALGDSEPERSLQLAREAEQRFPGSADAPEQAWYVCKSLVNLERFYEARDEARAMVDQYPGTPWAEDVARHLLVNPLDLPGDPAP
jgi:TolA-binding protein